MQRHSHHSHQEPNCHNESNNQEDSTKREANTCHTSVKKSFYPKLSSFSNNLFFDVDSLLIKIQRESGKLIWKADLKKYFSPCQFLNWKFYNVSIFEFKKIQRVRFWFKRFTTRQILDWKKYNALDFELKHFRHVGFWKNVCMQQITFWFFSLRENNIFCTFRAFWKASFWIENFNTCQILKWKNTTRQILNREKYITRQILKQSFSSGQILNKKFYNVSDFKLIFLNFFLLLKSILVPPDVLFTSFSSK